jgi:single-strand DNA-binding protein
MNQVTLIGNVGATPIVTYMENGNKVATFNIATSKAFKKADGTWQDTTQWHRVILWNKLAETQIEKGYKVMIVGEVTYRTYRNKENQDVNITEIVGRQVEVCVRREKTAIPLPVAPEVQSSRISPDDDCSTEIDIPMINPFAGE